MPVDNETKRRILADIERRARASGYFSPVREEPIDQEPTPPPPRSMSYTKPDPCEKIRAAERAGRITPSFARAAIALFQQGKITAAQVDDVLADAAKTPVGLGGSACWE